MNSETLHHLCGIDALSKPTIPMRWINVVLKFVGAESYVLGTKSASLSLTNRSGGFGLMFKDPVVVCADSLLGRQVDQGLLFDVVVCFGKHSDMPDLSLAELTGGVYPLVLRMGEKVKVT